ncbi:MAG: PKD domain-containing protein [Lewinellaceae bacterium]|nr:PKD domain-containing protein [Lewinellaceae bacterium]
MIRTFLLIVSFLLTVGLTAQTISGVVNRYAGVTGIDTCQSVLQVTDTSGFKKGDAVLLIQMQGAVIASGNNSAYGNILTMNAAGRYERAILDSVGSGVFILQSPLVNTYQTAGKIQVVRIAQYDQITVSDTLFAQPWNGNTGGVLALEVINTLVLNAPVIADGIGFRGGSAYIAPGNNCNFLIPEAAYFYGVGNWRGGSKGEGIALQENSKELGRGPQANGGGGGNDHNTGGGGGAHLTQGGQGGDNDEPSAFGCDGYFPGLGGKAITDNQLRLFPGGGGGAGHANNTLLGSGGNGGGVILIDAGTITGTQPLVSANGLDAGTANGDGGGGGGAGGTIWLKAAAAPANLLLSANGGRGGNTLNGNSNRCFGPGGGGSGGRILTNLPGIAVPLGGQPGIVTSSLNACNGSSNNAEAGENGLIEPVYVIPQDTASIRPAILSDTRSDTVCAGNVAYFFIQTNAGNWDIQWQQNDGTGWQDITANAGFTGFQNDTLVLTSAALLQNGRQFRSRIRRPGCFEITSATANLTVMAAPVAAFTVDINGGLAVFNNQSAHGTNFTWDFGDGGSDGAPNPQHLYATEGTYTVTLTVFNTCDTVSTTQQVDIFLLPEAGFATPDTALGCGPASILFENLSSENSVSFQWLFPGGMPENSVDPDPTIVYSSSGTYTATLVVGNTAGADTLSQTFEVQILDVAVANFTYTLLPGGVVQAVNASTGGTSYVWDFGDSSPQVQSDSVVSHQYLSSGTYPLTLIASNACGASVFQQNIDVVVQGVHTSDVWKNNAIQLYPNPLADYLVVDCSDIGLLPDRVEVSDILGRQVLMQQHFTDIKPMIFLHDLPAGIYWVQVHAGAYMKRQLLSKVS